MAQQNQQKKKLYAGIEAGGTKFNCLIANSPTDIIASTTLPTTTPNETLAASSDFFKEQIKIHGELEALGIACFGPVDLKTDSPTFGYITATPKEHWSGSDVVGHYRSSLGIPVAFDTDVNGAALGEHLYGAARGLNDFIYVTIGTGIGAGVFANGAPVNGMVHTEIGHMLVSRERERTTFKGICPFHDNCLTSLAAGPAIEARWNKPGNDLPPDHEAWDLEAYYLAVMCMNLSLSFSPEKIILGGGVMSQSHLYSKIRQHYKDLMNGYMLPTLALEDYIVAPGLPDRSGQVGALALSMSLAQG